MRTSTHRIKRWGVGLALLVLTSLSSLTKAEPEQTEKQVVANCGEVKILQFIDSAKAAKHVLLNNGTASGIEAGMILDVYRLASESPAKESGESIKIPVGQVKVVTSSEARAVGEIISQGTALSNGVFPKFPGIMAGDLAEREDVRVVAKHAIIPEVTLGYHKVFDDPKGNPGSMELSAGGKTLISETAREFAKVRMPVLMVEGYTDEVGPAEINQVESLERAQTVRQFIIEELGFDAERVIAVGFGELEPVVKSQAPGFREANRRIVIRVLPNPEET